MSTDHEDVPGADAAGRALRARVFAALVEIAIMTKRGRMHQAVIDDIARAGLVVEVAVARDQLDRVYRIHDRNPQDALATLRRMVEPYMASGRRELRTDVRRGTIEDCPPHDPKWPCGGESQ